MAYVVSDGLVIDDVTWPQRYCEAVRSAVLATAWLLVLLIYLSISIVTKFSRGRKQLHAPWRLPVICQSRVGTASICWCLLHVRGGRETSGERSSRQYL